jgi:translation initiation factor 2B subunit (eIF-2B alpha/beta/delta family)/8-oxo-dGTP pyrophosphatase MutT (NUDIX family)
MSETHVVTCFLRNRGEVLLFRRSDDVGSYAGQWGAVAGHAEGDPDAAAREEIREESGLGDAVSFVRAGESFDVADGDTHWVVHPYLFGADSRAVETNDETTEFEWASPTAIRRRETVPDLWKSYEHVAPTVEVVENDTDHGSAWLSVRALEVLRDRAGVLATTDADGDGWDDLAALADDLRTARPSMTVIENRINRAMADASDDRTPAAVERTATETIERALDADAAAAREAADLLDKTVLTLSRSGTVLDALHQAETEEIVVAESRPAREGVGVAEELADGCTVTLAVDAAAAHVLAERPVAAVLVGADTILPDGSVLNKVGTRAIAIAAVHEDVPVYAVAATDKISTDDEADFADGNRAAVYDGDSDVAVTNPTFDRTPPGFVTIVTEDGPLDPEKVADQADELRTLASWSQEPSSEPR